MSGTVTVPGVSGGTIALSFVGTANLGLAQQIANALAEAETTGKIVVDPNYTGGALPSVPAGDTLELVLSTTASGAISVPAAPAGVSEVLVIPFGPDTGETGDPNAITISGSAALSVIGGGPGSLTVQDPNFFVVGEGIGPTDTVVATFTIADSPYNVAMGQGFETVFAQGTGTVNAGPDNNVIDVTGGYNVVNALGNTTVDSAGFKTDVIGGSASVLSVVDTGFLDTVIAGSGATSVTASGSNFIVEGGTGTLSADDAGTFDTIVASTSSTAVTTGGVDAIVFGQPGTDGPAPLTVDGAGGLFDTVAFGGAGGDFSSSAKSSDDLLFAGVGSVSINASNTNFDTIVGGSGSLTVNAGTANDLVVFGPVTGTGMDFIGGSGGATVVGQAGNDTISGGSGSLLAFTGPNETLAASGGAGGATLFGAMGDVITYTGSGNLLFVAGVGNDTLNATGSSGTNMYWAAEGAPAGNSLAGGSGDNTFAAGTGPDTFSGGAGDNAYVFISGVLAGSAQTDVITNFLTGSSSVVLSGVTTVSASSAGSGASAFTTLTLSDNTKITFLGVSSTSELNGHIFNTSTTA